MADKPQKKVLLRKRIPQIVKDHRRLRNRNMAARQRAATEYLQELHGALEEPADEQLRKARHFLLDQRPDVDTIEHGVPRLYLSGLSDIQFTINGQCSDWVSRTATRWTLRAIHSGELLGVPATGREVMFGGVTVATVEDRKVKLPEPYTGGRGFLVEEDWVAWVVEEWNQWDLPGLAAQLRDGQSS